ncbi:hypothetical protein A2U01_0003398, partial [Trifolium medium]|nr:hypothetical protein [Trifolium medium]
VPKTKQRNKTPKPVGKTNAGRAQRPSNHVVAKTNDGGTMRILKEMEMQLPVNPSKATRQSRIP